MGCGLLLDCGASWTPAFLPGRNGCGDSARESSDESCRARNAQTGASAQQKLCTASNKQRGERGACHTRRSVYRSGVGVVAYRSVWQRAATAAVGPRAAPPEGRHQRGDGVGLLRLPALEEEEEEDQGPSKCGGGPHSSSTVARFDRCAPSWIPERAVSVTRAGRRTKWGWRLELLWCILTVNFAEVQERVGRGGSEEWTRSTRGFARNSEATTHTAWKRSRCNRHHLTPPSGMARSEAGRGERGLVGSGPLVSVSPPNMESQCCRCSVRPHPSSVGPTPAMVRASPLLWTLVPLFQLVRVPLWTWPQDMHRKMLPRGFLDSDLS